jgi:hypothetical protein
MVLVTFAGTKVTRVRADARIKIHHREATQNPVTLKRDPVLRRTRRYQNKIRAPTRASE